MEFRLKVVKSSNRTDIGIVLIFSDDEGANVFLGFCFLVVVITIDMCCAYVRRRIFNEMQQPSKCNETRSSFFSLFFYFFLLFFSRLVLWLSFRLETNRDLYGYFYNISIRRVKGRLDDDGGGGGRCARKIRDDAHEKISISINRS
jgi:ABC-type multidrug transport system fused ATPase/permease subunit